MESFSITFTGKSSTLESVFFPPVDLQGDYQIGLIDFQSYNSIYNVNRPNNKLYYHNPIELKDTPKGHMSLKDLNDKLKNKLNNFQFRLENKKILTIKDNVYVLRTRGLGKELMQAGIESMDDKVTLRENIWYCELDDVYSITLPEGNYEITDIEKEVQKTIPDFKLVPNTVQMSCTLKSSVLFNFYKGGLGTDMLGFVEYAEPDIYYYARNTVNINNVNVVRIKCNIASGSFINGKPDHTIHSFYPTVPPGYKLLELARNIIYYPINVRTLDVVTITIVDQEDKAIDFHNEEITIRCHIRKIS